jgi:tRNA threonylcarbamoyl adenosine modification protein YeaZ
VRILAIDSTTTYLFLAYGEEDDVALWSEEVGRTHATVLLPAVARFLEGRRPPEAVAVASGPGSYTGIRIGMATAEGLARGLGVPKVALPTFEGWLYGQGQGEETVYAAIDARGGRLFAAARRGGVEVLPLDLYEGKAIASCAANSHLVALRPELLPHRSWRRPDARGLLEAAADRLRRGRLPPFVPVYVRPAAVDQRRG